MALSVVSSVSMQSGSRAANGGGRAATAGTSSAPRTATSRQARLRWRRSQRAGGGERAMLARLGHLGYWLGCGLATVALVSGVFALQHGLDQDRRWIVYVASIGSSVACWLIGRACKYFLAGE